MLAKRLLLKIHIVRVLRSPRYSDLAMDNLDIICINLIDILNRHETRFYILK